MSMGGSTSASKRGTLLYTLIAVLSLFGLADAIYLTIEHITGQSVRCTIIAGCSEVLSSSYAVVAGYPLASIGALAYFSIFSLAILALFGYRIAGQLLLPLVVVMCLRYVVDLLQAFVIHAFCQFCLFSAAVTFALTGLTVFVWRTRRSGETTPTRLDRLSSLHPSRVKVSSIEQTKKVLRWISNNIAFLKFFDALKRRVQNIPNCHISRLQTCWLKSSLAARFRHLTI
jgi:uncharacterized membrane protein